MGNADATPRPIFVVGVPRSGTTMLRYMLCSHPDIYIPPESNFIPRFFARRPTQTLERGEALQILEQIRGYRSFWRDWRGEAPAAAALVDDLPELTPAALVEALYARYAQQYGATRWGDKSPFYVSYIDVLARMFPTGQFVHIIRDGRDVTASSLEAYQGRRYFYMDPYYHAREWRVRVRQGMRAGRRLGPHRYHEVRYEDLTADPEGELRRLCSFLGEEFHPGMATPALEARQHHHNKGIHRGVRSAVTTRSAGRWRARLTAQDQRLIQRTARPLLVELAYPLEELGKMSVRETVRLGMLAAKHVVAMSARRVLRAAGVFHPTRLLQRPTAAG